MQKVRAIQGSLAWHTYTSAAVRIWGTYPLIYTPLPNIMWLPAKAPSLLL